MSKKVIIVIVVLIILVITLGAVLFLAFSQGQQPTATIEPTAEPVHTQQPTPTLQTPAPLQVVPLAPATNTPEPTAIPTPTPTPTPLPTPVGLLGGKFPDKLLKEGEPDVLTAEGYSSERTSFTVTRYTNETDYACLVTYFVTDIYIQDIESLKTASAVGSFKSYGYKDIEAIARANNALVAITGDFYKNHPKGLIVRNGEVYRKSLDTEDICVIYKDGTMETYLRKDIKVNDILKRDPWQVWSFGPALLDENGLPKTKFNTTLSIENPRTAIGYYEPGHYCFVTVDGRNEDYSDGLSMVDLSKLMCNLGCVAAYNLDGGASAQLFWQDKVFNKPSGLGRRELSDIIYIGAYIPTPPPSAESTLDSQTPEP